MIPNLFVIGAAKSGTTSLHHYLGQHPDIFMSPVKEPNYFAFQGAVPPFAGPPETSGSSFRRDRIRREKYYFSVLDQHEYEHLFSQGSGAAFRGESSASYLYYPEAARRIQEQVPEARIIVILRHPVDRAYSKYTQMRRDHAEPLSQFEQAADAEPERKKANWAPTWLYLDRGFYGRQLALYFELFHPSQIHVLLYEDLRSDPVASMQAIFRFLDVDPGAPINIREHHNVSAVAQVPRSGLLFWLIARPYLLSARLQGMVPAWLFKAIRPIGRRLLLKSSPPAAVEPLSPETRNMLLAQFLPDIRKLEQTIGRDLTHWVK